MTERPRTRVQGAQSSPLGEYLRARRALLQPEDLGLPRHGARRVGGLRRQEVAASARISTDYYLRLEQGRDRQPSDQVVCALADALRVGDFGLRHMRRLVQLQTQRPTSVRPSLLDSTAHSLLDFWPLTPVAVVDSNFDVVLSNDIAQSLDGGLLSPGANFLLGMFSGQAFAEDGWRSAAERAVGALRFRSDPNDGRPLEIVARLSLLHPDFRRFWARHDSQPWPSGSVRYSVQGLDLLPFRFQTLDVPHIEGWSVLAFHAADQRAQTALGRLSAVDASRAVPRDAVSA